MAVSMPPICLRNGFNFKRGIERTTLGLMFHVTTVVIFAPLFFTEVCLTCFFKATSKWWLLALEVVTCTCAAGMKSYRMHRRLEASIWTPTFKMVIVGICIYQRLPAIAICMHTWFTNLDITTDTPQMWCTQGGFLSGAFYFFEAK
jgi:hypothetical protein